MSKRSLHIFYLSLLAVSFIGHLLPEQESVIQRAPALLEESKLIGNLQHVHIGENKDLQLFAKIDTGAESSSLHAEDISTFYKKEDGQSVLYVKFKTMGEDFKFRTFTRPVVKISNIKSASGTSERYFIREKIWIGDSFHYVNVNLADRSHLKRKFLVGKNILDEGYLINTALTNP